MKCPAIGNWLVLLRNSLSQMGVVKGVAVEDEEVEGLRGVEVER